MAHRLYKTGLVGILELPGGFVDPREIVKMRDGVRRALTEGTDKLVVDLGHATNVNSMMVGAMVEMYTSFTNVGGFILFAAPSPNIEVLLHTLRLDQVFEIVPTVDEALARLSERHSHASP